MSGQRLFYQIPSNLQESKMLCGVKLSILSFVLEKAVEGHVCPPGWAGCLLAHSWFAQPAFLNSRPPAQRWHPPFSPSITKTNASQTCLQTNLRLPDSSWPSLHRTNRAHIQKDSARLGSSACLLATGQHRFSDESN